MRQAADAEDERNPGTDLKVGHYKGENHKPAGCRRYEGKRRPKTTAAEC
jgi:hypothetical protein